jgi:hypothetical protein
LKSRLSSDRDILPELPIEWLPQKDALIVQAGFDPAVTDHIGIFSRQWKNHPRGSVVVATDWNFLPGQPYAISREQI